QKHLHRTALAPITPFRRGILCHESISSGPDRQPHRRHRQRYRPARPCRRRRPGRHRLVESQL
ncbi:TetR family transcriptional regulator, partial [Klebsiella pneumoniae]